MIGRRYHQGIRRLPGLRGYFTRTADGDWQPLRTFRQLPNVDWDDPNLRFVDLDGDGNPDVLITEHEVFTWYRSRARDGFEAARKVARSWDEREGPALVFADGEGSIHLADMSGDGLVDLVRVRNGEVCYWPNLGYGRFGRQVRLGNGPLFDTPDLFDPRRLRFADIDGTGTTDLLYLGRDGVRIYLNQAGNRLAAPRVVKALLPTDGLSSIDVVDLLGQGTACLVWSTPLPGARGRSVMYVDLLANPTEDQAGTTKPHLLQALDNGLGAVTKVVYAPSTRFYLEDKAKGKPWVTRLPFPVQVVERIIREDEVSGTRLVTRHAYHHGFFDGYEREFRGFACVEQWDAETIPRLLDQGHVGDLPYDRDPDDPALNLPTVRTITWFHTGAWLERERLELALARDYYQGDPQAPQLPGTELPEGLSAHEQREAMRALRGQVLRQEVYAADGEGEEGPHRHPYAVTAHSYRVETLQAAEGDSHAVFFSHPRHSLSLHYERDPADPRLSHEIVLQVGPYGDVERSAAVAYPRRGQAQHDEQSRGWATITEREFEHLDGDEAYHVGIPTGSVSWELTGLGLAGGGVWDAATLGRRFADATETPYEDPVDGESGSKRRIAAEKAFYCGWPSGEARPLDARGALPLRPHHSEKLAFTPGLLARAFGDRIGAAELVDAGYRQDDDGSWWAPTGHVVYDRNRFYLPMRAVDPWGNVHSVDYDDFALTAVQSIDAARNETHIEVDYHHLAPRKLVDPHGDGSEVARDALGMVTAIAIMGRDGEGDTLDSPTIKIAYDLSPAEGPAWVETSSRETHQVPNTRWLVSRTYTDGFGREVMKKARVRPGPVPARDAEGNVLRNADGSVRTVFADPRWVGSGRVVFDNKGNPVKQYQPYFSATEVFEDEPWLVQQGVTPILRYDPVGRVVRTDLPDGTFTMVEFTPWVQVAHDQNDTVQGTDWDARMSAGTCAQRRAARLARQHHGTPARTHADSLGRPFLSQADNGPKAEADPEHDLLDTRVELDIAGNQLSVTDARGVTVLHQTFDLLGRVLVSDSADAGLRRGLPDVAGAPLWTWHPNGFVARHQTDDPLRRPTRLWIRRPDGSEAVIERVVYGEGLEGDVARERRLRGRAALNLDGAGLVRVGRHDFKGNVLETARVLARHFRGDPDWSSLDGLADPDGVEEAAAPLLEAETFTAGTTYDALNRVTTQTAPDGSVTRPSYDDGGQLQRILVDAVGVGQPVFLDDVEYNERGQRTRIVRGNGVTTQYTYDPLTFRLATHRSWRTGETLQDLEYTYDPVGNIVAIDDAVHFGSPTSADRRFSYDPTYRLIYARGREHPGQQAGRQDSPFADIVAHPNDGQALVRYTERYQYDRVGNIERIVHRVTDGLAGGWSRAYDYAEDSNRLRGTSLPGDVEGQFTARYPHDAAGNILGMPHLRSMEWDHADRLVATTPQGSFRAPGTSWYRYDGAGQRVRKTEDAEREPGTEPLRVRERIYLGGYEVYREYDRGGAVARELRTLHVMDGMSRVALVETEVEEQGVASPRAQTRVRYQLEDHLGSSAMELTEAGELIGYEEYHPYGSSAWRMGDGSAEVSAKRYRYTGKERDEETGLYYYGARYYAAWLGRWMSADPAGMVDGPCLYGAVRQSPINRLDTTGHQSCETVDECILESYNHSLAIELGDWFLHGLEGFWEGIVGVPETIGRSTRRTFEGWGGLTPWGEERALEIGEENSRMLDGLHLLWEIGSDETARRIARTAYAAFRESMPPELLEEFDLAVGHWLVEKGSQLFGASFARGVALEAIAGSRLTGLVRGLDFVLSLLTTMQSELDKASDASRRLRDTHPLVYDALLTANLDMLWYLVEPTFVEEYEKAREAARAIGVELPSFYPEQSIETSVDEADPSPIPGPDVIRQYEELGIDPSYGDIHGGRVYMH